MAALVVAYWAIHSKPSDASDARNCRATLAEMLPETRKFFVGSINQSKPVTPRRCWSTPTDAFAATAAHLRLSSATRSNDDIDWPVHSLMLSFLSALGNSTAALAHRDPTQPDPWMDQPISNSAPGTTEAKFQRITHIFKGKLFFKRNTPRSTSKPDVGNSMWL